MIQNNLVKEEIKCDLCIVGGGMAGVSAALTASRLGLKVTIVQERPVFGGNASSEVRMWICGDSNIYNRETGILEEIALENYYYNPHKNHYIFDSLLINKVKEERNIFALLNATCFDAKSNDNTIESVTCYQMTTQKIYEIEASLFADCSGDSILGYLVNAKYMYGREDITLYDEKMIKTHTTGDNKTMGNSLLIQARKTNHKSKFIAPPFAKKISVEKLKTKNIDLSNDYENFWYIEIGGEDDVISNAEDLNFELLSLCLGIWDTIKNSNEFDSDYFELSFIGFLPAKRESRRLIGDYVMNANDIVNKTKFVDEVAYGGWPLDDHYPLGFYSEKSNESIPVDTYGIPLRCLYSNNIKNLLFAGRNISMTHLAMSSARVMGTCTTLGEAIGVSSFVAIKKNCSIKDVDNKYIDNVQQLLLKFDCYLPNIKEKIKKSDKPYSELLENGLNRNSINSLNFIKVSNDFYITNSYSSPVSGDVKIVFDSDLERNTFVGMTDSEKLHISRAIERDDSPEMFVPKTLAKDFIVIIQYYDKTQDTFTYNNNLKRNIIIKAKKEVESISLKIISNYGNSENTNLFGFYIVEKE